MLRFFNTYAPCIRISKYRGYFCLIDAFYGVDYNNTRQNLFHTRINSERLPAYGLRSSG